MIKAGTQENFLRSGFLFCVKNAFPIVGSGATCADSGLVRDFYKNSVCNISFF